MFALTRDGARVAPDAGLTVKEKPETSHPSPRTIKIVLTPPNVLRLGRNRLLMKRVSDTPGGTVDVVSSPPNNSCTRYRPRPSGHYK